MAPARRRLLAYWFDLAEPVGRAEYVRHGAGLMAFKYAVDALIVYAFTGAVWTPSQYLSPFFLDRPELLQAPDPVAWVLVAWTLPFLWVGVAMTLRRALDAGGSPWVSLLFFVPFLNYVTILALALIPGRDRPPIPSDVETVRGPARTALVAVALGAVIVLGMVIRVDLLGGYGATLFLGTPFVVGAVAGYLANRERTRSHKATAGVVLLALAIGAGSVLLFALEGALCILMAFPVAAPLGFLGGVLGRAIALYRAPPMASGATAALALPLLLLPALPLDRPVALREVVSAIDVDAPPDVVWDQVVGFSEIEEPPALAFRLGVAYPIRARIEGAGVGAVRYCEFSTGSFVEPITAWEPGARLAFGVSEQPRPLEEWSPYARVHPPHLDGYFRSRRGEFRLTPLPGGGTHLEGSTFYELEIFPQIYWRLWSDALIHAIHRRVLRHVKAAAEEAAA